MQQHPEFSLAPPTCDVTSERFWRAALPQQFLTSGVLLVVDNADTPSDLGISELVESISSGIMLFLLCCGIVWHNAFEVNASAF